MTLITELNQFGECQVVQSRPTHLKLTQICVAWSLFLGSWTQTDWSASFSSPIIFLQFPTVSGSFSRGSGFFLVGNKKMATRAHNNIFTAIQHPGDNSLGSSHYPGDANRASHWKKKKAFHWLVWICINSIGCDCAPLVPLEAARKSILSVPVPKRADCTHLPRGKWLGSVP